MGLDQFMNKYPRYKDATVNDVSIIEDYFGWIVARENKNYDGSFFDWCGRDIYDVPSMDCIEFYNSHYKTTYYDWDKEKKYPSTRIMEEVGYWRKFNALHNYIVKNIQNGVDDCGYYEVSKEQLEELLDICQEVLESCAMMKGKVKNGEKIENGKWVPIMEDGLTVIDDSVAKKLLPPCSGFFFGSTDIDQYYVENVARTIEIISEILATTDFEKEAITYCASW